MPCNRVTRTGARVRKGVQGVTANHLPPNGVRRLVSGPTLERTGLVLALETRCVSYVLLKKIIFLVRDTIPAVTQYSGSWSRSSVAHICAGSHFSAVKIAFTTSSRSRAAGAPLRNQSSNSAGTALYVSPQLTVAAPREVPYKHVRCHARQGNCARF